MLTLALPSHAQNPTYLCEWKNDTLIAPNIFQFEVYIYEGTATPVPFNLNNYQFGFKIVNAPAVLNGGTLTGAYISGTSELTDGINDFYPSSLGIINIGGSKFIRVNSPFPSANYLHIPQSGLRVGTFRVTNTANYNLTPVICWNFSPISNLVYVIIPPNVVYTNVTDSIYHIPYCTITGLQNLRSTENDLMIYPNPATVKLTIDMLKPNACHTISIYNISGQLLIRQLTQQCKTIIDISGFNKGVYILKVSDTDTNIVKKIIKE
jgi:hypothetical protein